MAQENPFHGEEMKGFSFKIERGMSSVKQSKVGTKKGENLVLEPLQSSSLFGEIPTTVPPIQVVTYDEGALEETLEEFEFEGAEGAEAGAEEKEEVQAEQAL